MLNPSIMRQFKLLSKILLWQKMILRVVVVLMRILTLYVDHFEYGKRSVDLNNNTKAHIETSGQIKARVVGSRSETQDNRELQLIIETHKERIVVNGDPDEARKAQGFVRLFVETAATAELARKEKETTYS